MNLEQATSHKHDDITAKAIFCRGNELLLLRRPNGRWDLPGGKARSGEPVADALLREVREETNLVVRTFQPLSVIPRRRSNGRACHVASFLCTARQRLIETKIKLSDEHDDFAFVRFDVEREIILPAHQRQAIDEAWRVLSLPAAA